MSGASSSGVAESAAAQERTTRSANVHVRDSAVAPHVHISGASSNGIADSVAVQHKAARSANVHDASDMMFSTHDDLVKQVDTSSWNAQTAHDLDFRNRPLPEYPDSDNESEVAEKDVD
eukprot:7467588-Karenia_brevis.AAC.1